MLKILLSNDDGFYAEGLQTLYHHLKNKTKVVIVAPDRERSAVGHGITMHQPLRVTPVCLDGTDHWLVNGTPADSVKLAIETILKDNPPDLIISGINRGPNLGNDILYSGTVSAAVEGTINGYPSIAASLNDFGKMDFNPAAAFITENIDKLSKLARKSVLNINFPKATVENQVQGVKFTKLGMREYQNVFEERTDPRGRVYYWMSGDPVNHNQEKNSDIWAVDNGYISITPLKLDLTNYDVLTKIELKFD